MLPKNARLKSRRLFARALNPQLGIRLGYSSFFTLLGVPHLPDFLETSDPETTLPIRFGIIVSKKVDKRAVVRNKLKRRYRHILRNDVLPTPGKRLREFQAIVIIVKKACTEAPYQEQKIALQKFLSQHTDC